MDHPRRAADPVDPADPAGRPPALDRAAVEPAQPVHPVESWAGAPVEVVDEDDDLLADVSHRPGRTTVLLIAGILAVVAFAGGVWVQKQAGGTAAGGGLPSAAGGFGARQGAGGGYGGFPGAGAPGAVPGGAAAGGAVPGGAAAGGGAATGGAAGAGSSGGAGTPVVVGTVSTISGSTLTVKNLGGKSVTVTVPEGAAITLVAGKKLTELRTGATVSVSGTTAADGKVTATTVTVRS